MINTIYIEETVRNHHRTREIRDRYRNAQVIYCDRYSEIFNRKAQNFRLQKQNPALILAKKFSNFVLESPESYGLGSSQNYYFSHMLNCLYDCRYCFLQGMYRSAYYVLFVNYEDFQTRIAEIVADDANRHPWFFTGYDCDSLALEPVTNFMKSFYSFFRNHSRANFELRTKSTQVSRLLELHPISNVVVAFSLAPQEISRGLEHRAPSLAKRINAIKKLQDKGWKTGLRFDPVIYVDDYEDIYDRFFDLVFNEIDTSSLHSVSLGPFRMPEAYFKNVNKLFPDELLFAGPLVKKSGIIGYEQEIQSGFLQFCESRILGYIPTELFYPCT